MSNYVLKPGHFEYYVMKLRILFKCSVLAGFSDPDQGGKGPASLLPVSVDTRFPTWPPLTPKCQGSPYRWPVWKGWVGFQLPLRAPVIGMCVSISMCDHSMSVPHVTSTDTKGRESGLIATLWW